MLDICFGDFANRGEAKQLVIVCDSCDAEAFIFQDEGNFCLGCWQERTEPQVQSGQLYF